MKYAVMAALCLLLIDMVSIASKNKEEIRKNIAQTKQSRLVKVITPRKDSNTYKAQEKLIERARVTMSVEGLQAVKLVGFILAFTISASLVTAQYSLEVNEIFNKKTISLNIMGEQKNTDHDDALLNQLTKEAHENISYKEFIKGGDYKSLQNEVIKLTKEKDMEAEYTLLYAEKVYYNLLELYERQKIGYIRIAIPFLFSIIGALLPKAILRIRAQKTEQLMNIELNKLEILTLLLLKRENTNIYQILLHLKHRADVFKPYLTRCVNSYQKSQREAIERMQREADHEGFKNFINILKQGIDTNKQSTAEILEITRRLKNSIQQSLMEEKIQKKNRRILIIRFPMILMAVYLLLLPMIKIFYENF